MNTLAANALLATEDGRQVLEYLVSCALPEGVTLVGDFEGVQYEFPGGIGLAPRWVDRRLTRSERRWISACIIARVNLFASPVAISLRGPHPALTVDQAEGEGQLDDRDCAEEDFANPGLTTCGFTYAGDAADFTPEDGTANPHTCTSREAPDPDDFDDGEGLFFDYLQYEKCFDQPVAGERHKGAARRYREVITVYVYP